MRRPLPGIALLCGALGALGAVAACAATGVQDTAQETPVDSGDGGSTVLGDAAHPRDAADEGFGEPPVCSPAGWCQTELPVSDIHLVDVWPVGSRAFAVATSTVHGIKFLEWDAAGGWKFIDKKMGFSRLMSPVNVWAPDENEVFFAISDTTGFSVGRPIGALVLRGTRPTPPETTWSWTRSQIDCPDLTHSRAQAVLWGASRDEVYLAVCESVYRLNRSAPLDSGVDGGYAGVDGGAAVSDGWELEYAVSDANFQQWTAVTGTGTGDVWFVGIQAAGFDQCVLLIRKTSDGYTTVVDGVPTEGERCVAKPGVAMIPGQFYHAHAPVKDRLVGVHALGLGSDVDNDIVQVAVVSGEVQIKRASPASTMDVTLRSVWGTSPDDLWVIADRGAGSILRATSVWDGVGKFEFSTLAINGAPNLAPLSRIRGTSNQNLWAVGRDRAYFKSTP